jgi:fatty acid desaturase
LREFSWYIHHTMTQQLSDRDRETTEDRLTPVGWVVLALCVIGVVVTTYLALEYSGIALFDGHAADVITTAWNRTATIGLIVALVVAVFVSVFVWLLAKSTLGSDPDD